MATAPRPLRSVNLLLTDKCTRRCAHCYYPKFGKLDPLEALSITKRLKRGGLQVSFVSGEVLTDTRYLGSYSAAAQKFILTNAELLLREPELFDELRAHGIETIIFSMNFEMSALLGSVSADTVREAARLSISVGFTVHLSALLTSQNFMNLPGYCSEAVEMGAPVLDLFSYIKSPHSRLPASYMMSDLQQDEFRLIWKAQSRKWSEKLLLPRRVGFKPTSALLQRLSKLGREFCPAGTELISISPDKKVYGCNGLVLDGLEIGELTRSGIVITKQITGGDRSRCLGDPNLLDIVPLPKPIIYPL